jgi:hypothetical protein
MLTNATAIQTGLTPNELGKLFRVSSDKILSWIRSGELGAINTASNRCGRPRFVILPRHIAEFENRRKAADPPAPPRRRRQQTVKDYYPD